MSILGVAIQNMLAHEDRLIGDTTPVKPHIRAWQKQISDRIAFSRFMLSLELPLTHTAVPSLGSVVPTFTRATTKTWQNNDGYMVTGVAGEIGFVGARRVRNLLTYTEDFSNAAWTPAQTTVSVNQVIAPNGTTTADKLIETVVTNNHVIRSAVAGSAVKHVFSVYAKAGERTFVQLSNSSVTDYANFDLSLGVLGTVSGGTGVIESAGNGWYRCSLITTLAGAATQNIAIVTSATSARLESYLGDGTSGIYIWGAQLEDVTGQSVQTAGEYVSVGVESAPYYHGSFVDGVKCFPTDLAGNPLTTMLGYSAEGARTNLCLQSNAFTTAPWLATGTPAAAQNAVGPDGATSAWTLTDNAAGATESIYQGITLTAAAYTGSVFVAKTEGVQSSYPVIFFYPGDGTQVQAATVDTTNGVITDWTSADASTMASGRSVRIVSFNDDFWRVELTKTGTAANHFFQFFPAGTTSATYAGPTINAAAQGSAVFANAQVELGSFASSYIPTTTIAVARNADVLKYSGGDISALANLYGEFIWRGAIDAGTNFTLFELNDGGTTTNSHVLRLEGATAKLRAFAYSGSALQLVNDHTNAFVAGTQYKTSSYVVTNDAASMLNGADRKTDTSCTPPAGTLTLAVGCNIASGQQFSGNIRNLRGWLRGFSASEQTAITS